MTKIKKDFLPEDLIGILANNKIDGCIAVQADQSTQETKFLLDHAAKNSFIKGVVGWVDLCDGNVKHTLKHYAKNPFFKGVRHIVQAEPNGFLLGENFQNGINKLKDFNLTYDILIYPKQLKEAIDLVKKNPDQDFVLDHIAKPLIKNKEIDNWSMGILEIGSFKNVYCKLSGIITEADWSHWQAKDFDKYLSEALEAFGTDRLMFGSDWPVCLLAGSYQHVVKIVELFLKELKPIDQNKIMGENARNFYSL